MRCAVHCPKPSPQQTAVLLVLGGIALGAYLWLHLWLVAAALGVVAASYLLSVAAALVMMRVAMGVGPRRPRRAESIRLSATVRPAAPAQRRRPAVEPTYDITSLPVNRAAERGVTRAERTADVTPAAAPQAPTRLPVGVPRRPGAVRDLGDSGGGQRALGRGGLP